MRAAQGAAAPVTKPKKEPGVDARPVLALSVQPTAAMNPRTGGRRGHSPGPFFPTAFFWKESGAPAGQAPPGGWASIERATTGRPYGRRAGSSRPTGQRLRGQTGGYYPPLRAWQLAYRAGQARTLADGGSARGPTPTAKQAAACRGRRPRRPAPRGHVRFRTKKRAARDTGGACVYRSSRKYAKPRLAGGCLSRLLRREVKISTTTVTT